MCWAIFVLCIQSLLYLFVKCNTDLEWIDPFKLESEEIERIDPFKLESEESTKQLCNSPTNSHVIAYYKRTINLILASVIIENSDPGIYKGRLFVDISLDDYEFLKRFTSEKLEEPLILQKVDEIVTRIFTKSRIDELSDVLIYWSDYIYFIVFNRTTGIYLTVLVVLIVIYKLLKASYTPYQVIIYLLLLGFLVDFTFTWKRLLQELEINKYADSLKYSSLPADCKLSQMSGWHFFLSFISGANNCREYHKIVLYDVFWDVGPLDVMAHQSRMFTTVASNIGVALSKLVSGLMSDLPFPLNVLFLPMLLLFLLFLIWSVLTYITDTHIDLNLFHLVHIKFKTNQSIRDKTQKAPNSIRNETEEVELHKVEKRKDKKKREKRKNMSSEYEEGTEKALMKEEGLAEHTITP